MSGPIVGGALGALVFVLWTVIALKKHTRIAESNTVALGARHGLQQFADQSLNLQSVEEILGLAGEAALAIFGSSRLVAFQIGGEESEWLASIPGQEELGALPAPTRGLFGWFRHNTGIAVAEDLGDARFGAMRSPLRQVMETYKVDVVLPLVNQSQVIAVLGISLGRSPSRADRELVRLFRLQATAACANVRLHVEAAHMVSLAKEVDLAGAVKLALVPDEMEGDHGRASWAGYYQAVGQAGSDFWGIYPIEGNRVILLIGDAVGAGLAGSLVSAVVKSCADAIFDSAPSKITPAQLLGAMNRSLYRSHNAVHTSCFALLLDVGTGEISHASAGHPFPYHARNDGLGVLVGSGPLLGDEATAVYRERQLTMQSGEHLILFTDGLVKAQNEAGESYGERRLQKILKATGGSSAQVRDAILESVDGFRGSTSRTDDAGLLVLRLDS